MLVKTEIEVNKYRNMKKMKYIFSCDKCKAEFSQYKPRARYNLRDGAVHKCQACFSWKEVALKRGKRYSESLADGEKWLDHEGYWVVRIGRNTNYSNVHLAKWHGYIREHQKIIQDLLGRKLLKGEIVHHIDGDKTNNDIKNLDICTQTEHNKCHAMSEEIVFELYKKGIVDYDRITKRYFLK